MKTLQEIPLRASANPALPGSFDAEFDIVVVGGGGGGLPAALFARWLGNTVGLLEKAPELGGTALKAAFWYWVPNNKKMQDKEEDGSSRPRFFIGALPSSGQTGIFQIQPGLCGPPQVLLLDPIVRVGEALAVRRQAAHRVG